jgi:aspartate aminotransferase-like enzyme
MGTTNDVLIFASSGTGAMDASVSNLFSKGDKVMVCVAGKFGERWTEICKAYGLDVTAVTVPYGQAVAPQQVEEALAKDSAIKGVFLQASETSTGAAHDVRAIAAAVAKTGAILVVDAITGLGTQPLDIHGWGLDVVIGGSQKAFMIPPGLAFMAISPKAWALAETSTLPHFYFNLKKEKKSADAGESSWTPSTALILALGEALKYVKKIGMANLIANAQLLAEATRAAAGSLGLELFSASAPGWAVTAVKPPAGMDSGVIVKEFRSRFGAIIANGQGSMKGKVFRVAHLGYFDFADLFAMVAGLEIILRANGHAVTYGTGVRAVQEVYEHAASTLKPVTA